MLTRLEREQKIRQLQSEVDNINIDKVLKLKSEKNAQLQQLLKESKNDPAILYNLDAKDKQWLHAMKLLSLVKKFSNMYESGSHKSEIAKKRRLRQDFLNETQIFLNSQDLLIHPTPLIREYKECVEAEENAAHFDAYD